MPDEELLRLASQKALRRPSILEAQVKRMLRDPRSRALPEQFASQWLQIRESSRRLSRTRSSSPNLTRH